MRGEPLPLGVRSLLPQDHRGHEKELWRMGEGTGGEVQRESMAGGSYTPRSTVLY